MSQQRTLQPLFGLPRAFPVRLPVATNESLQSYVHRLSHDWTKAKDRPGT
jgi:hypothetical protein